MRPPIIGQIIIQLAQILIAKSCEQLVWSELELKRVFLTAMLLVCFFMLQLQAEKLSILSPYHNLFEYGGGVFYTESYFGGDTTVIQCCASYKISNPHVVRSVRVTAGYSFLVSSDTIRAQRAPSLFISLEYTTLPAIRSRVVSCLPSTQPQATFRGLTRWTLAQRSTHQALAPW